MKKKIAKTFISWLMVLLMMLNLFSFGISHAEGTGVEKTSVLTDVTVEISQMGVPIEEGGTLISTDPISVEISFGVPVEGDEPTPADPVRKGDWAAFPLSDAFILVAGYDIPLKAGDITVGHVSINKDPLTGMVSAGVLFDGDDEVFDGTYDTVSCKFSADFEYDADGAPVTGGEYTITILEKTYTMTVPPVEIVYGVAKSGMENLAEKYIEWMVEITATQAEENVDLSGYEFSDNLVSVGAYIAGSFKVGGSSVTPVQEGTRISYVFPQGSTSPQTITFRTEIADSAYHSTSEQNVTNIAQLFDSDEEFIKEGGGSVTFTPQWIEKTGEPSDKGSSGVYNPKNRTITWTITANHMGATLQNVVITDLLPEGLTLDSAHWQKWSGTDWGAKTTITPNAAGKYALGDIDAKILLTIVAKVPDEAYTAGVTIYENSAKISWSGLTGEGLGTGVVDVGVGYNAIGKSGEVKDRSKGIIGWSVTVDPKGQTIPDLKVYDLLVYGSSLALGQVAGLPTGLATADLTPRYHQKYVDGSFVGGGLTLTVHAITLAGVRVADLIEVGGFTTAQKTFTFNSLIVNPDIFAGNKSTTIYNTAMLFSGTARLNAAWADVDFVNKILSKEMLKREATANLVAGVNNYTTNSGAAFDYQDMSVIFRLSVNADSLDLTNMENAAGEKLGQATLTDILPEGWEFVNIRNNEKYLIFSGEKDGSTVKATGSPLTPALLDGFGAAFSTDGRTAGFTFTNLDQPYVILVKAKPKAATLEEYFSKNATWLKTNTLSLKAEKWTTGVTVTRDVKIVSKILDKSRETSQGGVLKEGEVRWTVDYRPYNLALQGTKVVDKLPEGIELRTDSSGNLLLSGGNITVHELNLNSDGSYTPGVEIDPVVGDNLFYDPETRELTFMIADGSKGYRFSYITDITGEPGTISNKVTLYGTENVQEDTDVSYVISKADGAASLKKSGWIAITKKDGAGAYLAGVEFTLYTSEGNFFRKGITGADGTLRFKVIPDGEYVLKETSVPDGYTLESVSRSLIVTTAGDHVVASIDGREGEGSNLITIKNYLEGTAGNLTIKKVVAGNGADETKLFSFAVTFVLPPGTSPDTSYSYVGSGVPGGGIKSGDTISLAHGQSITITGLPAGAEYTVTEDDYRDAGYITTTDGADSGTIAADETLATIFTNTRDVGALKIEKLVAGNGADETKEFEFTVIFDLPAWVPSGMSYPYTGAGVDDGSIQSGDTIFLSHGQSITIWDLPVGAEYTVSEEDYRDVGYVTNHDGASGAIVLDDIATARLINVREVGELTIKKTVWGEGADETKAFAFTVILDLPAWVPSDMSYPYRGEGVDDGSIQSGDTILLAHGQSITIKDLPAGTEYRVTENDYTGDGYLTYSFGDSGTVVVGDDGEILEACAEFTNALVDSMIKKNVNGEEDINLTDRDEPFTYHIEISMPEDIRGFESMIISDILDEILLIKGARVLLDGEVDKALTALVKIEGQRISLAMDDFDGLDGKVLILAIEALIRPGADLTHYQEGAVLNRAALKLNNNPEVGSNEVIVTPPDPGLSPPYPELPKTDYETNMVLLIAVVMLTLLGIRLWYSRRLSGDRS